MGKILHSRKLSHVLTVDVWTTQESELDWREASSNNFKNLKFKFKFIGITGSLSASVCYVSTSK